MSKLEDVKEVVKGILQPIGTLCKKNPKLGLAGIGLLFFALLCFVNDDTNETIILFLFAIVLIYLFTVAISSATQQKEMLLRWALMRSRKKTDSSSGSEAGSQERSLPPDK